MFFILDKDMIEESIVAHPPGCSHGFAPTVPSRKSSMRYYKKLKACVYWRILPVMLSDKVLCWQSVYCHYRRKLGRTF